MITSLELKNVVLPCVALRKHELHNRMLSCTEEELIKLRIAIDEYKRFENFLTTELKKEESSFIRELNK